MPETDTTQGAEQPPVSQVDTLIDTKLRADLASLIDVWRSASAAWKKIGDPQWTAKALVYDDCADALVCTLNGDADNG